MKAIAQERRRFGYRRLLVMLKRKDPVVNHKKLLRLYREEKLAVRRRGGLSGPGADAVPLRHDGRGLWTSCRSSSPTGGASASS